MRLSISTALYRLRGAAGIILGVYLLVTSALIWYSETSRIEQERTQITSLASKHAMAVQLHMEQVLSATYTLATLVQLNKGDIPDFEMVSTVLRSFYPGISALVLAPDGVIRRSAPLAGNEKAIGMNLLTDPTRDKEAILARDTGKLSLAGPWPLVKGLGGQGAAGRLPVFLPDENGVSRFWGFVSVLIRFPDVLAPARLPELVERGYDYELWRVHPDTGKKHVIAASSSKPLSDPVERALHVPNSTWTLSVAPAKGWNDRTVLAAKIALALFFLVLLTAALMKPRRDAAA